MLPTDNKGGGGTDPSITNIYSLGGTDPFITNKYSLDLPVARE